MDVRAVGIAGVIVGIIVVILGVYIVTSSGPAPTGTSASVSSSQQPPQMFKKYPAGIAGVTPGSGWVTDPGKYIPCELKRTPPPKVEIDGDTATLIVPANLESGVVLESQGKKLTLEKGDSFEVSVDPTSQVNFSSFHPCAGPEGLKSWFDPAVDSPFKNGVGGLEFAIGNFDSDLSNRFMPGTFSKYVAEKSGDLRFRIVEIKGHYDDGNSGYFPVTVHVFRSK